MIRIHFLVLSICIAILGFFYNCNGQTQEKRMEKIDRQPIAAGRFYPSDSQQLRSELELIFKKAKQKSTENQPIAIIVPHAGYVFSAEIAAKAIELLNPDSEFEHIFIIGSSHTMYFEGASIYTQGDFITPLGKVEIDSLASVLAENNPFHNNSQPHTNEHSIEVQLPLLQFWLKKPFKIVPIIIGGESEKNCRKIADALSPYFNNKNLFIISSDFAHYPNYDDALKSDSAMAGAICTNNSKTFLAAKKELEHKGLNQLVTATCGWTSVLTLLNITEKINNLSFEKIAYQNSGDTPYGDKLRVVGYNAIGVFQKKDQFSFSELAQSQLLNLARATLNDFVIKKEIKTLDSKDFSNEASVLAGAFVTLRKKGKLRGCIGTYRTDQPIYNIVQAMTISSAEHDSRFSPVTEDELKDISIEISVLSPLRKIQSIDEITLGKHGIYIKKDGQAGVFLPQVATETGWNKEEFLGHCARDKAFIGWNGWKDAEISVFEAFIIKEKD